MNPTEGLKDEESSVLDEVLQTGHQEEVVYQNLDQTQIWLFGWFLFFFGLAVRTRSTISTSTSNSSQ